MPEMNLRQLDLCLVLLGHLEKAKQEFRNQKKQGTPGLSTDINYTRPVFNIIWCMEISKLYQEEMHLTNHCMIMH